MNLRDRRDRGELAPDANPLQHQAAAVGQRQGARITPSDGIRLRFEHDEFERRRT